MTHLNLRLDAFSVTEHFSPFPAFYRRPTTNLVLFTAHEIFRSKKVDSFNLKIHTEIFTMAGPGSIVVSILRRSSLYFLEGKEE